MSRNMYLNVPQTGSNINKKMFFLKASKFQIAELCPLEETGRRPMATPTPQGGEGEEGALPAPRESWAPGHTAS